MPKSSNHHLAQITWKEVTCQLHKQTLSCYSILLQDLQGKPTHHLQRHPDTSASALARLVSFRTSFLSAFSWKTSEWCHFTRNAPFGTSRESRHASRIKKRNGNTNKLLMLLTDKRLFPEVSERYPYHFYEWIWAFPWREARTPQEALGLVPPCQFHLGRSLSTGKQRCG